MDNVWLTVFGFALIFLATTLGAALVFFFKKDLSPKANTIFLGFAGGIMIAASVWSLLLPAIESSQDYGNWKFVPAVIGLLLGALFMVVIDKLVPHFHKGTGEEEGLHSSLSKPKKMFLAMTIHNVPEGLAVGFAFGGAALIGTNEAFLAALGLSIGIAIQNFPEGAAVALPMVGQLNSKHKAFLYGALSGIVEPIAAIIGYFLASALASAMPWLLAFAAGAMLFVVVEDLIPDAHLESHPHLGTWSIVIGFALMMVLDVALG
ncbi:MAG: ZIP family metal transporter [Erysipelotrichaceae bacterium]|nr:ZIP family metal transporter [Erysipelotrichaceae bacterium]